MTGSGPKPFVYEAQPARILFGPGRRAELGAEVEGLGRSRAIVLSTPEQAGLAAELSGVLGPLAVAHFTGARMHTPLDVTEKALAVVEEAKADCVVAVGGGSTTGLSKAIAVRTGLAQIVVPTTYAGSEVTPILGETVDGIKTTRKSPEILPEIVIYDPELTLGLPMSLSISSGINAIAHAAEALYARDGNPIVARLAAEGIAALAEALPVIKEAPSDPEARGKALYGAWLCGTCLGAVGMALHHKLCHVLGGAFDLPHAPTHAAVLPHALAYNAGAAPEAMAAIAGALGTRSAPQGLFDLLVTLDAPRALADLGMPETGIAHTVDLTLANPYWNPAPLEREALTALVRAAHSGQRPKA